MPQPLQLLHRVDPKQQILRQVGPIVEDIQVRPYEVLVVPYLREKLEGDKVTRGGLMIPDNGAGTLKEDLFQGKVCLVLKVGASAFVDEPDPKTGKVDNRWKGFRPAVGDWVVISVSDTFSFDVPGGWRVRLVDENLVRAIVPTPDMVW